MSATRLCFFAFFVTLQACASDNSGLRIVQRSPEEFCRGSARSIATDAYAMKARGVPLSKAVNGDNPPLVNAITRAIYSGNPKSEAAAADLGTSACLEYFRGK
jgi:hypothetical protein